MLIAIDNGHGRNTTGKRTPRLEDGTQIREWQFNYPTAKKLNIALKRCGFKTLMVSDTETDTVLSVRTNRANKAKADLFVSIHYNAFQGKWGNHGGIESYVVKKGFNAEKAAKAIHTEVIKATGRRDRGIKEANFYVLRKTNMPAVLIECGFMDNLEEAKLMLNESYQSKVAEAICKGICKYAGKKYIEPAKPKPKPISNVLYKVQVGAFSKKANADKLAAELKKKGFSTYIVKEER